MLSFNKVHVVRCLVCAQIVRFDDRHNCCGLKPTTTTIHYNVYIPLRESCDVVAELKIALSPGLRPTDASMYAKNPSRGLLGPVKVSKVGHCWIQNKKTPNQNGFEKSSLIRSVLNKEIHSLQQFNMLLTIQLYVTTENIWIR